jgi:hypothetical protein
MSKRVFKNVAGMPAIRLTKTLSVLQFQRSIIWPDEQEHPSVVGRFFQTQAEVNEGGFGEKERLIPVPNGTISDNLDALIEKVVTNGVTMLGMLNAQGEDEFIDMTNAVEI